MFAMILILLRVFFLGYAFEYINSTFNTLHSIPPTDGLEERDDWTKMVSSFSPSSLLPRIGVPRGLVPSASYLLGTMTGRRRLIT